MSVPERFPDLPRILVALMTAILVIVVGATYATAQTSEPVSVGTLTVPGASDGVQPGELLRFSGAGFAPGASIAITMESTPVHLKSVHADASGAFSTTAAVPRGMTAGRHLLKATGADPAGGLRILSIAVTVRASQGSPTGAGTLPRTGSETMTLLSVAAGAIAAGSAILVVRRRRV